MESHTLLQVVVIVMALMVCGGVMWVHFYGSHGGKLGAKGAGFDSDERAAVEEIDQLQKKVSALGQKVALVEEHAGEYFYVLHDQGWAQVVEAVERLEQVSKDLDDLIGNGDFDSALRLAVFVANRNVPFTADLADLSKTEVSKLENWEVDVDRIIMNVAVALGEAAVDTKNLGIERTHKRKPTLMAVQEIKNLLTVRRDSKPQIKDW